MTKRVLLVGGNGFLGSHLKDHLLAGGYEVRSLDRAPERFRPDPEAVEHIYGEVGNRAALDQAFAGVDAAFHLAWCTNPKTADDDPTFDVEANLVLTTEVLKAAARHGVPHLLFFSSGGTVYGPSEARAIPETHPTDPICSYGATKLAAEKYLSIFARRHGFKHTVLRTSNPYGPRQDPRGAQGAISVFLDRALRGQAIHIWGDGQVVRDYVHVRDLCRATERALLRPDDSPALYNLGSGRGLSLLDVVKTIEEVTGQEARVAFEPARPVDVPWNVLDVRRAREALGYSPAVEPAEGVERTAAWMREALHR